ncbi:MAG: hypothetical protein ABT20_12815 [Rubrivivax sp. SCN 70-15]|nr:MAG: hypothetical protein ABT20_12815 [Rubrivivax sp. SCN 70-15]
MNSEGRRLPSPWRARALLAALVALAGCAGYAPRPLPSDASLIRSVQALSVDPAQLPFRRLATHRFDASDGLDIDEVAMLAVANNPGLRVTRDKLGIARAQAYAAGLLPDPQLGLSSDHPTNGGAGNTNAFGLNLGVDLGALVARSARRDAAGAALHQVDLELLWQEWQVASQARLLFTRLRAQARMLATLAQSRELLGRVSARQHEALAAGNVTADQAASALVALQAVQRQIDDGQRHELQDRQQLAALLGLAADVRLELVGPGPGPAPDAAALRAAMAERLARRPDLLALRAGYAAQEAKFRAAVLAQFPALNLGLTRARDTSGLYTLGFGLSLTLPIFDANRGNIAIEGATRQRLYDEYRQRLDSAHREVDAALANLALLQAQLERSAAGRAPLERLARQAGAAASAGDLTVTDQVRLATASLDKSLEVQQLEEARSEQLLALDTLLGPDLASRKP